MKKMGIVILCAVFALCGSVYMMGHLKKIDTGYTGVVYSMRNGVGDETLSTGWHMISPFEELKKFTISNEQIVLSKDKREGSERDDSFKVSTSDDANIGISFQMSYRFIPDQVVDTFKKFKGMDGEDIVEQRVKTVLKSKISEVTTNYSLMDIYSGNRSEINDKITEYLNEEFSKSYGIEVLDASIIDSHPDKDLKKAINNRVKALQEKQQAQAEQEKIKVEAETKLIQAQADAKVQIAKAEAEAKANKIISASITDELIRMTEAEARKKHGWITTKGVETVVKEK